MSKKGLCFMCRVLEDNKILNDYPPDFSGGFVYCNISFNMV